MLIAATSVMVSVVVDGELMMEKEDVFVQREWEKDVLLNLSVVLLDRITTYVVAGERKTKGDVAHRGLATIILVLISLSNLSGLFDLIRHHNVCSWDRGRDCFCGKEREMVREPTNMMLSLNLCHSVSLIGLIIIRTFFSVYLLVSN